jgi:hypothetical protein
MQSQQRQCFMGDDSTSARVVLAVSNIRTCTSTLASTVSLTVFILVPKREFHCGIPAKSLRSTLINSLYHGVYSFQDSEKGLSTNRRLLFFFLKIEQTSFERSTAALAWKKHPASLLFIQAISDSAHNSIIGESVETIRYLVPGRFPTHLIHTLLHHHHHRSSILNIASLPIPRGARTQTRPHAEPCVILSARGRALGAA